MATNDFVPVAPSLGANVLTQSQYLTRTAVTTGYASGVAESAAINKSLRQGTLIAAVVAQYIADISGQNVVDDGSTATILANLKTSLRSTSSVVGACRGLRCIVSAASATATFTAVESVVETSVGGQNYRVASLNQSINLATIGANGMDTGTAPISGFVAIYLIFNPVTQAVALIGKDATSGVQTDVYTGGSLPAGYTASALLSVWPTNASRLMVPGLQLDRKFSFQYKSVLSSASQQATLSALSVATTIPPNAKRCSGFTFLSITASGVNATTAIAASGSTSSDGIGQVQMVGFANIASTNYTQMPFSDMPIMTPQTLYYAAYIASGTFGSIQIFLSGYDI